MKTKTCNRCHTEKPIDEFYKLRSDRNWRRSYCKDCHKAIDKVNRKIRKGALSIVLILLSLFAIGQSIEEKRQQIVDSINYYRENPTELIMEHYGIDVSKYKYEPVHGYVMDDKLTKSAQKWADKMAKKFFYGHEYTQVGKAFQAESLDLINTSWQGDYIQSVERLIRDKDCSGKSHRIHMVRHKGQKIGVGIAYSHFNDADWVYVVIRTD